MTNIERHNLLMKAKPILFNTEMVRAIMDGSKTVTRRVVKLKHSNTHLKMRTDKYGTRLIEIQNEEPGVTVIKNPDGTTTHKLLACIERMPPYRPGDILYVRETWSPVCVKPKRYLYKTHCPEADNLPVKWHPSIHMPKEAARIFLRVTSVRVERLHDILTDDCLAPSNIQAEGLTKPCILCIHPDFDCREYIKSGRCDLVCEFVKLWDSTIKKSDIDKYGWEANPWVWVIEFERIN